ncbi:MAG: CotH kinase family protein [Flavobacteriales bacterium]
MKRKKKWLIALVLLAGMLAGGAWFADRALKHRDHPGLRVFLHQWATNYPASFAVEPLVLSIHVEQGELDQLQKVVDAARDRGVIMPDGNDYVAATVEGPDGVFKARIRIKGKLTDHVQGSKWSFRVIAKKDGGFLGMQRFSLQHPGTRNYLCDWFYHRLMQGEGIIALRYGFIRLHFNDEDLGIYAYEEHFGPELLEHNGRLKGPLFRFDPALFWEHRLNEMNKLRFDEPFAAYQAAALDAFDSGDLAKDDEARAQFEEAVSMIEAFRRGKLKASEVFDADRIARRHAILDLVGGHHSMDWSDLKFYFDPVLHRVEPVSYESFSAFPLRTLAGSDRWVGRQEPAQDLHDQWFNDEELFRAYVHHLERLSRTSWLDSAFTALKPALDSASAVLYREFPYKELDHSIYYKNQKVIRRLLDVPKGFHAYLDGAANDTVRISIVPIEGLPIEVHGLVAVDGSIVAPLKKCIVPCRKPGHPGDPVEIRFVVGKAPLPKTKDLRLSYSVLGASVKKEAEVFPFEFSVSSAQDAMLTRMRPNAQDFSMLVVDDSSKTITIKPGTWTIDRTLVIPAGYRCVATWPLKLNIVNGAEIISYSPIDWNGNEESPIEVTSADSSSHGVHVLNARGGSHLAFVRFHALTRYKYDQERSADVSFHLSDVVIDQCSFSGTGATLLDASICAITLTHCGFNGGSDQLETHFAKLNVSDVTFALPADDAVSVEGGSAKLERVNITGRDGSGVGVKGIKSALITTMDVKMGRMSIAFEGRDGSALTVTNAQLENVGLVADAKKSEMRYGPVKIELTKVSVAKAEGQFKCGEGSSITLDGKKVAAITKVKGT